MSVLLLRLAAPMQSWGTRSRFGHRDTELEPSKSGVIGLLCAALGWPREAVSFGFDGTSMQLEQFARALKMAVRVDQEGRLMRDYHTAQDVRRADPSKGTQETVLSERFYLADANFLVGLEGERPLLDRLDAALRKPVWTLFLGRMSFVPALPIAGGVHEGTLLDVLAKQPWILWQRGEHPQKLRGVVEVAFGTGQPRQDVPLSFVSRDRRFGVRHVDPNYSFSFPSPLVLDPIQEPPHVSQQTNP